MNVGIIPARGGSEAIKKKNIVPFRGKPLIAHTISQADACEELDEVYVSTDDEEIASVSSSYGASIIQRPAELATDTASTEEALLHALEELTSSGVDPGVLALLQCTSPLRRRGDIGATVRLVTEKEFDSALSCCKDHSFYWQTVDGGAEPVNYDPKHRDRRQDLPTRYRENGAIYAFDPDVLRIHECRLGGSIGIHEMPKMYGFEVDTHEDLELLRTVAQGVDFFTGENGNH